MFIRPKNNFTKFTFIALAIGLITIVTMTFMRIAEIDTQGGGGWGIFDVIGKLLGLFAYAVGFILLIGILHSIAALLSQYVIKKESTVLIIFVPIYIIVMFFSLNYVYKQTFDIPKYDLSTVEGTRDQENEFIEEYKESIKKEKRRPNLPAKEIVSDDELMLKKQITTSIDNYLMAKDSLEKDSLIKLIVMIFDRGYNRIDDDTLRTNFLKCLKDSVQAEIITYSPDLNYFFGMLSFMDYNESHRPEERLYNTAIFIGDKRDGNTKVYFYGCSRTSGSFFLRENAKTYTLSSIYRGLYLLVLPNGLNISPLDKTFWTSKLFDKVKVYDKTYERCQIDTSYEDTVARYKVRPYLLLK